MKTIFHKNGVFDEALMMSQSSVVQMVDYMDYMSDTAKLMFLERLIGTIPGYLNDHLSVQAKNALALNVSSILKKASIVEWEDTITSYMNKHLYNNQHVFLFAVMFYPEWFMATVDSEKIKNMTLKKYVAIACIEKLRSKNSHLVHFFYDVILNSIEHVDERIIHDMVSYYINDIPNLPEKKKRQRVERLLKVLQNGPLKTETVFVHIRSLLPYCEMLGVDVGDHLHPEFFSDIEEIPEQYRRYCAKKMLKYSLSDRRWLDYCDVDNDIIDYFPYSRAYNNITKDMYVDIALKELPISYTFTYLSFNVRSAAADKDMLWGCLNRLVQVLPTLNIYDADMENVLNITPNSNVNDIIAQLCYFVTTTRSPMFFDVINDGTWIREGDKMLLATNNPGVTDVKKVHNFWENIVGEHAMTIELVDVDLMN